MRQCIAIAALFLILAGCASQPKSETSQKNTPKTFEAMCESIIGDINVGLTERVIKKMDLRGFVDAIWKGRKGISEAEKSAMAKQLSKELVGVLNSFSQFSDDWDMVRLNEKNNRAHCIIRSAVEDDGVSYVDFQLVKKDNKVSIIDWYNHGTAILASEAFGAVMVDLSKIYKRKDNKTEEDKVLLSFLQGLKQNEYQQVASAYSKLAPKYKDSYVYALRYLEMVKLHQPKELEGKTDQFIKQFGETRYYGMFLVDHYYEQKKFRKVIAQLDKALTRIGDDNWLFILKAISAEELKDNKLYYQSMLDSLNAKASRDTPYWMLLQHFAKQGKYNDALLPLNVLKKAFSYQFTANTLADKEKFGSMGASEVYQNWLEADYQ